jgi:hypothetical protein
MRFICHMIGPSIPRIVTIKKRRASPIITALTLWLVFIIPSAAQEDGVIYCGSHTSSDFVVSVRVEPGKGLLVEHAYCGEQIALLGVEGGYAKIKSWYSTGYVSLEFVQLAAKPLKPAISLGRAFIDCDESSDVPVYSNLQAESVMTALKCLQPVSFIDMERGYVRIQIADRTGYVDSKFIRLERLPLEPKTDAEVQPQHAVTGPSPDVRAVPQQEKRQEQNPAPAAIVPADLSYAEPGAAAGTDQRCW